jgi:hypothetical protein
MSKRSGEYKSTQEAMLTSELKQRVGIIEEQWAEALGTALQDVKERVKSFLEANDGWEDMVSGTE